MIGTVTATRVRCDQRDQPDNPATQCESYVASDGVIDPAAARLAAAERGWSATPERQLCPKHRAAG